jgi:hypothetical protein
LIPLYKKKRRHIPEYRNINDRTEGLTARTKKITEYCDIITDVSEVHAASIFIVEECWLHRQVILKMEAAVSYEDRKNEFMEKWHND